MSVEKMTKGLSLTDMEKRYHTPQKVMRCVLSAVDLEEDKLPQEVNDKNNNISPWTMDSVLRGVRQPVLAITNRQTSLKCHVSGHMDYQSPSAETMTTFTGMETNRYENRSFESGYFSQETDSQDPTSSNLQEQLERLRLNPQITETTYTPATEIPNENTSYCGMCEMTNSTRLTVHALEVYKQDDDGDNQLHMCIIQAIPHYSCYLISVAPKSDWLNITNNLLQTALHLAVITRQVQIVRRLMVGGADITILDSNGNSPLHIACKGGYIEIALTLLNPVRYEELHENEYDIAYQKIPQDLDVKNYDGQSCLHLATEGSHVNIIKLLLSKGANINARDGKSGRTVLHYATESANFSLIELLITVPALNIDAETFGGETSVMLALGRKQENIASLLILHGAKYQLTEQDVSDDDISDDFYDVHNTFS